MGAFFGVLVLLWLPIAAPLYWWLRADANLTTIVTMGWLFVAFVLLTSAWGHWLRQENLWERYGLEFSGASGRDLLRGLAMGWLAAFGLFAIQSLMGWQISQPVELTALVRVAGEGLASAFGIALAEELLFRGWLLSECERDYPPRIALWANALVFALLHFLKPIAAIVREAAAFPGLVLLGLVLVEAKRQTHGRLGLSVGLHAGLVWGYYIVAIGGLLRPAPAVPIWLTGISSNPIASVPGWLGLIVLGIWLRRQSLGEA